MKTNTATFYFRQGALTFLIVALLSTTNGFGQLLIDAETGVIFPGRYNDIRRPNEATQFNPFGSTYKTDPAVFYRIKAGFTLNDRHTLTMLVAPLTVESNTRQTLAQPITFNGTTFGAGRPLRVRYSFDSYRLTYRYNFVRSNKLRLAGGISVQLRSAAIELANDTQRSRYTNLGPVPLLSLYAHWRPANKLGLLLDADALAGGGGGRAEDLFAGLTYQVGSRSYLKAGYRVLEGGVSGIEEIYNYTWINYASIGLAVGLK